MGEKPALIGPKGLLGFMTTFVGAGVSIKY